MCLTNRNHTQTHSLTSSATVAHKNTSTCRRRQLTFSQSNIDRLHADFKVCLNTDRQTSDGFAWMGGGLQRAA